MATLNLRTVANGSVILSPTSTATDKTITLPATDGTMVVQDSSNITSVANLNFTGTGGRITGDFSNGTVANRVAFQTSTTNANTTLTVYPNGTGSTTGLNLYNGTDPLNSSIAQIGSTATETRIASTAVGSATALPMTFSTGGSERLRIDTSGNLGLGVAPSAWSSSVKALQFDYSAFSGSSSLGTEVDGNCYYNGSNWIYRVTGVALRYNQATSGHSWHTAPSGTAGNAITFTERANIQVSGKTGFFVTTNDGLQVTSSEGAGTSWANFVGRHTGAAPFGGTASFVVYTNGNVVNTNNSYGALSDIKLKENIVPTSPKLDKLLQVEIVNYNLKDAPENKLLGVVAQQLEQVFPSLVEESPDRDEEGNDLGTTTKSVKYSVFVPMLIKAVQELTARLEVLENK